MRQNSWGGRMRRRHKRGEKKRIMEKGNEEQSEHVLPD